MRHEMRHVRSPFTDYFISLKTYSQGEPLVVFTDKKNREIIIKVNGDCAYAYHDGKEVGFLETTGLREIDERFEPDPALITGWNVDPTYQRAGIATEMVRQLVGEIGKLAPGHKNPGYSGTNALTDEGEALTEHCQGLGYIYEYTTELDYDVSYDEYD